MKILLESSLSVSKDIAALFTYLYCLVFKFGGETWKNRHIIFFLLLFFLPTKAKKYFQGGFMCIKGSSVLNVNIYLCVI